MTKATFLKIDVTDWAVEHDEIEPQITGEDDMVNLATRPGMTTAKVARLAIISRAKGNAPANILPENKPLLNSGAAQAVAQVVVRRHIEAQLPNGNMTTIREFLAPVREEEEGQEIDDTHTIVAPSPLSESFAPALSEEGKKRAMDYLFKRVTGYIYNPLKTIAVNGGDVRAAADELKDKIDKMVERLG